MLPDYLAEGLRVVFCGTAVGLTSAERGRYYAGAGNDFWGVLYEVGIIPEPLGPSLDYRVLEFGVGLTDLAKGVAASSDAGLRTRYDVPGFIVKMDRFRPAWVAFHGKEAAKAVAKVVANRSVVSLAEQDWSVAQSLVFVVPSMSGSNRDPSRLEGRATREEWFAGLRRRIPKLARGAKQEG